MATSMNNSIIIRLPVLHKAVNNETKVITPSMPALQFSLLVNNAPKACPQKILEDEPVQIPLGKDEFYCAKQIENGELPPLETIALPSWLKPMDPPQFSCRECGDTFLYEKNLKRHLRRRSVRIKFPCTTCKSSLAYFNRCALLAHVRTHSDGADLEKVVITPLDRDSLLLDHDTPQSETPNGTDDVEVVKVKGGNRDLFRCSECFEFLESSDGREKHFSPIRSSTLTCSKCPVVCPSKCSLEAHQRIHLQIHPFICPECGREESKWESFQHHLNRVCFHYARTLGYKCMLCDELEISASVEPHKHMLATHSEAYYKCQACPMAFKGPTSFDSHKKLAHPAHGDVPCKTIFKCPLCDTVFHGREQLIGHLNVHMKDEKVQMQPIFSCPQCSARYRTLFLLKDHFRECHSVPSEDRVEEVKELQSVLLPPKVDVDGSLECKMCHQIYRNVRSFDVHSGRRCCHRSFLCVVCGRTLRDLNSYFLHEKEHLTKGELLCMLCHAQKVSKEELSSHLQRHVDRFKLPYSCTFCEESLRDCRAALNHVRHEHHLGRADRSKLASDHNHCDPSSKPDSKPLPPIKIRIPLQLVRQHSEESVGGCRSRSLSPTPSRTYIVPTKKLRLHDGSAGSVYICAKCDFKTPEQKEFHKHIQFHRKHASALQCPDCGTCFVVENTLRKHLKVSHRVKDIDAYLERSGFGGNMHKLEEVQKSNSRQCTICYQNFDTDSSLKSHMRSHGMAFIRSRTSSS